MGKIIDIDDFKYVKNSLKNVPATDHEFCEDLVDYIDTSSSNNDDEFFYDMIPAIRFIDESGVIAYTKEDRRIYLSCPGTIVGRKIPAWEFTYDHECLHQLWESFDVAKEIQSKGIEYNHELFNIASDCVINDYLRDMRGKTPPDGIIFPEDVEKEFGVKYDRSKDTQFSLYIKLLGTGKKPSSQMSKMANPKQGQGGQGQSGKGSSGGGQQGGNQQGGGQAGGQSGQGGQGGGQHKDFDKMSKDEAKAAAQADAQRAQDAADKAKSEYGSGSEEAKKAQEAADKAKAAADKAKRARSENGARKAAKEAEAAANEAENISNGGGKGNGAGKPNEYEQGDDSMMGKGQKHNQSGGSWGSGTYTGGTEAETDLDDLEKRDLANITAGIEKTVKKYSSRISGAFGNFIRQCKFSHELRQSGLASETVRAKANWKKLTYKAIDSYINNQVFQKKREWKNTYQRPKRGSGIVKMGEPIQMGRIPKEDKLDIPIGFYIDKSGSMYSTMDRAAKAMYGIAQDIKKEWYRDKIIGEMDFRFFAFDTQMHELKVGQVPRANDDNMSLAEILEFIATRPKKDLINIIITDGQYPINDAQMAAYFKNYDGLMVMVINNVNSKMKALEDKFKGKFVYVQADSQFSL